MHDVRGYRWASIFFGLVLGISLAFLPHAIGCCSRFSAEDMAIRASFGNHGWAPGITPLAVAMLDWPMGFRLLVMTLVAACLCLVASLTGLLLARRMNADGAAGGAPRLWYIVGQGVLGSFMVGVLYILAAYAVGYEGYLGPRNALWFVGLPLAVALVQQSRLQRAILWTFPLLLGGWVWMAVLSMTVGIPLD
jgi:hypothetical protein